MINTKVTLLCLALAGALAAPVTYADQGIITSTQVSKKLSVEYLAGESESISSAKEEAKIKFMRKVAASLPTYITSIKEIKNNNHTETVEFLAASTVKTTNERYSIEPIGNQVKVTLTAIVTIDEQEIKRLIKELKTNKSKRQSASALMAAQSSLLDQIQSIKQAYKGQSSAAQDRVLETTRVAFQDNQNFISELKDLPVDDMVAEFEFQKKRKIAERRLYVIENRNREYSSMTPVEIQEMQLGIDFSKLANDGLLKQLQQPFTFRIVTLNEEYAGIQVIPLNLKDNEEPQIKPWYEANPEAFQNFRDDYNVVGFLNSGCGSSVNKFSLSGYSLPIVAIAGSPNYLVPSWNAGHLSNSNFKADTKKGKSIWSFALSVGREEFELPFIHVRRTNNSSAKATNSLFNTDVDSSKLHKYDWIHPFRINNPICGSEVIVQFPTFRIKRAKLDLLKNTKISVIKSTFNQRL